MNNLKPIPGYRSKTVRRDGRAFTITVPIEVKKLRQFRAEFGNGEFMEFAAMSKHAASEYATGEYRKKNNIPTNVAVFCRLTELHPQIGTVA